MSKMLSGQRNLARRVAGVTTPINRKRTKYGRNWPCLCGSGKKYKNCCQKDIDAVTAIDGNGVVQELSEDVMKLIDQIRETNKKNGLSTLDRT